MIVIYTFDFKKNAPLISKNEEYMMLVVSIQSALEGRIKPIIYIYSGDIEFINRIKLEFGNDINIKPLVKKLYCNNDHFTCAGHARIDAILELVGTDNLLYVDNDTLFAPDALYNIQKQFSMPCGYRQETYGNTFKNWINAIKTSDTQQKNLEIFCKNNLDKYIINNGVQYYPNNLISIKVANDIYNQYYYVLKNFGYNHGLDQLIFSNVLYNMNIGLEHNSFQINHIVNTVWHAYCVKKKYRDNLIQLNLYSEFIIGPNRRNVYYKLENLYLSTREKSL